VFYPTKKKLNILTEVGPRIPCQTIKKIINLEKTKNIFRFSQNKHNFPEEINRNHRKFRPKTRCQRKLNVVFERAEDGFSSHALMSISKFLTKTHIF